MRMKEYWMEQMEEIEAAEYEEFHGDDYEETSFEENAEKMDVMMFVAYHVNINDNATMEEVQNHFWGRSESKGAWLIDRLKSTGQFEDIPEFVRRFVDWNACADQLQKDGYVHFVESAGWTWVFCKTSTSQKPKKQKKSVAATSSKGR